MAGFLRRATRANNLYLRQNVGAPSLLRENAREWFPNLTNMATDDARQAAEAAQNEFIAATLRYESGAAIPEPELMAQRRRYFPMPGDSEETLRIKDELRRTALEGLAVSAGPGARDAIAQGEVADIEAAVDRARDRGHVAADGTVSGGGRLGPDGLEIDIVGGTRTPPETPEPTGGLDRALAIGLGDVVEGAGDIVGLVGNPLNAGINWATGSNLSTDFGQLFRDFSGLPSPRTGQEQLASSINRGGIAALGLSGAARGGANIATGGIRGALERFGSMPAIDLAAGSAGGGSGELARQNGAGPVGQTIATLLGGAAGAGGMAGIARRFNGAPVAENALVRAGREEGVNVNRVMVDPASQARASALDGTLVGRPIIRQQMENIGSQIEGRVQSLGLGGAALDDANAGAMVQRAAQRNIQRSGARARDMYDSAEAASEGVRVTPTESLAVLDDMLTRLRETPETNGPEIQFLERLRNDFSNDLSVSALRRVRTQLRKRITNGGLVFGEDEATVLGVMDAASRDIETGLRAAGNERAAGLFRRADDFYRDRMQNINGTIQRLIGRRNAELPPGQVAANMRAMAAPRGDNAGLARFIREMDPEEQADTAATFAQALGRNNRGDFSTAHFITQAERMPAEARVNIFGQNGARSINNLITLARAHDRVMSGLNRSNTSMGSDWRSRLYHILLGGGAGGGAALLGGGGATAAAVTAAGAAGLARGAKMGRDALSARALMSPDLTQWLRSAPQSRSLPALDRHIAQLGTVAARNPAIAPEVLRLQEGLLRAMNDNVRSVAAGSGEQQE